MTETVELKNCPFCGAAPHKGPTKKEYDQLHGDEFQRYRIWCPHGHASVLEAAAIIAASAWNTRSDPAVRDRVTDEMVEAAGLVIGRGLGFNPAKAFVEHKTIALAALTAALRTSPVRDRVKPLEWHDDTEGPGCPIRFAAWPLHGYRIHLYQWGEADRWAVRFGVADGTFLPDRGDAEAAKATVQAEWSSYLQRAALRTSPPEPASGWMPIETAPKDGTVLLAITMEAQSPASRISWWDGDGWVRIWKAEKFVMPGPARWWPTHWQHLPAPPAKEPQ